MRAALGYDPNSDFNSENKPMRQVKGKKKTEAPVDTWMDFGKEWTKKDKLGNPDYNVGYDPNYRLAAPLEDPKKPDMSFLNIKTPFQKGSREHALEAMRRKIVSIKDPNIKNRAFDEIYLGAIKREQADLTAENRKRSEENALWQRFASQGYSSSEIPALIQKYFSQKRAAMEEAPLFNPRGR
jgi:hypothetical protein